MRLHGQIIECSDIRDSIVDAFDGNGLSRNAKRHIRHCPECSELHKGLRSDQQALRALAPPGPLAIYLQMLFSRGHGPKSGPPTGGRFIPVLGTGLASVAIVAGLMVGSGALDPGTTSPAKTKQTVRLSRVESPQKVKSESVTTHKAKKLEVAKVNEAPTTAASKSATSTPSSSGESVKSSSPSESSKSSGNSKSKSESKTKSSTPTKQNSEQTSSKREKPRETELGTGGSSPSGTSNSGSGTSSGDNSSSSSPTESGSNNSSSGTPTADDPAGSSEGTQSPTKQSPKGGGKKPPSGGSPVKKVALP